MKRTIVVSEPAERDFREIARYIARENPDAAVAFIRRLRARTAALAEGAERFRERSEWSPGLRSLSYGKYHVAFRIDDVAVSVLRVIHSARDIPRFFEGDFK